MSLVTLLFVPRGARRAARSVSAADPLRTGVDARTERQPTERHRRRSTTVVYHHGTCTLKRHIAEGAAPNRRSY
jgi:hypothetical protein